MVGYQSGLAEINGAKLFYEVKGEGMPLVMLHGYPLDSRMWDCQFEELSKQFQVVRFDFAGNGQSTAHDEDYSLVEDIRELLRFLEIKKTYLMGLSVGGNVSIDYTLAYPETVEKLILVSTGLLGWTNLSNERQKYIQEFNQSYQNGEQEKIIDLMCKSWVAGPFRSLDEMDSNMVEQYRDMLKNNLSKGQGKGKMLLPDTKTIDLVKNIAQPTLIISPEVDFPEFLAIADFIYNSINGSEKVVLPGTAHMLNMERPSEFNQLVLQFLNQ